MAKKHLRKLGAMPFRRLDAVDALRGLAMLWMTAYHLCFDLNHFGFLKQDFYADPFWTWQRSAIVSLFLFTAGLGQSIAVEQAQSWRHFWRRWAQIAGAALLVSAASYAMYPQSFIYFGVLHGIALMLPIVRVTAGWGRLLGLLGIAAIAIKFIAAYVHSASANIGFLDQNAFNWLGLVSRKPITEDFVPLFPWLGLMWWGMAAGHWALRYRRHWLGLEFEGAGRFLALLGRWSLSYYLLHQAVLMGLLMLISALTQNR